MSKFSPLIINISKNALKGIDIEKNMILYKTAILSLCKFMCISQKYCEENLPILFDILESDLDSSLKLNVCAAFGDLINRFPNVLQKHVYKYFLCLKSKDIQVVRYAMNVISHLVLNDMLKLKGEIVEICLLLESNDQKLKDLVNLFFYELNQKGNNAIYNVIPKALAKLSNEYKHLEYSNFQNIVKNLLKYVEKDKHTDGLIDKLFNKLKTSTDTCEWRNNTYCLSLLNYNDKTVNKLFDLYQNLKEKIDDEIVNENFQNIFNKYKRNTNVSKETVEEIEKKFFAGQKINVKKTEKGTTNVKGKRIGAKRTHTKMLNKEKENEEDDNYSVESQNITEKKVIRSKRIITGGKKVNAKIDSQNEEDEDYDESD